MSRPIPLREESSHPRERVGGMRVRSLAVPAPAARRGAHPAAPRFRHRPRHCATALLRWAFPAPGFLATAPHALCPHLSGVSHLTYPITLPLVKALRVPP